jgi:hypothetical protein
MKVKKIINRSINRFWKPSILPIPDKFKVVIVGILNKLVGFLSLFEDVWIGNQWIDECF